MIPALLAGILGLVPQFTTWQEAVSQARGAPIVLYLSRSACTFCPRFEREVLGPVLNSRLYADMTFRELLLDGDLSLDLGPLGKTREHLAEHLELVGTPTILFLDAGGREVARRYVGHAGDDYMIYRLERSLRQAREAQRAPGE